MNTKLQQLLEQLTPFIVFGIAIALFVGLLFVFFYVVLWGLLIGGILWLFAVAKEYLYPSTTNKPEKSRVIDHDGKK